jgi:glycosyltransferase involved in cell wall biosynthesis
MSQEAMTALIEAYFDADYYLGTNPDVAAAGFDPLEHYRSHGWREGRWPAPWFDPEEYRRRYPGLVDAESNPFSHFLTAGDPQAARNAYKSLEQSKKIVTQIKQHYEKSSLDVLAAVDTEKYPRKPAKEDIEAVASFFDAEFYQSNYPEVRSLIVDPLVHFLTVGWQQGRDPSPGFSVRRYCQDNDDVRESQVNPFVHYCRSGRHETGRRVLAVAESAVLDRFENDERLVQIVREAIELEPMVALPDTRRKVVLPPRTYKTLAAAARSLRMALTGSSYDYVVIVPHIRMSGAARVSSIFTRTLANIVGDKSILVVCTESSEAEYLHWFPANCELFDGSAIFQKVQPDARTQLLYDLLRGVGAKAFFNINSRLAWEAMKTYGRQLSQEFRVYTYLFTWDETASGVRVGYPIQWLRYTNSYHHLIFTDSVMLANDIRERFSMDDGHCSVIALHTPTVASKIKATPPSDSRKTPLFLWAGRFDRQKRTDLLLAIAENCPEVQFHIYGKPVLENEGLVESILPPNCILKGAYKELSEVFEKEVYSGFLYTAQWDGIPTVLLEIGSAGLPIIASDVGGISELITDETGWLITPFHDIHAYTAAIEQIIGNPTEAGKRVEAMKRHLASDFSEAGYHEAISNALVCHGI